MLGMQDPHMKLHSKKYIFWRTIMKDKSQDESIKAQIIELLGKGYTRIQLIKDFNFA